MLLLKSGCLISARSSMFPLIGLLLGARYCRRVYEVDPTMRSSIFHILLRIYLRPRANHPMLFGPALALISAHASSIDAIEVFDLLPPLVALSDIKVFLEKTLRRSGERVREAKILKAIGRSTVETEERSVVDLEERRVKITDSRVYVRISPSSPLIKVAQVFFRLYRCPQCHKRLGNSVIAVHSPQYVFRLEPVNPLANVILS